jgi:oligopeptide transport system permease protein
MSSWDREQLSRPPVGFWQDVRRRFLRHRAGVIALCLLTVIVLFALLGPVINHWDYREMDANARYFRRHVFTSRHWLGVDGMGRDFFKRLSLGARITVAIGIVSAIVDTTLGLLVGAFSGYYGGRVDAVLVSAMEVVASVPFVLIVIMLRLAFGGGVFAVILALCLVGWVGTARVVRGQIMQLKQMEFVLASRALGAKPDRVIARHLIPNCVAVVIVNATLDAQNAIMTEAFLSFIGIGVIAPMPSLGSLLLMAGPVQRTMTLALLSGIILSLNLLSDALRDALDPKLRQ